MGSGCSRTVGIEFLGREPFEHTRQQLVLEQEMDSACPEQQPYCHAGLVTFIA